MPETNKYTTELRLLRSLLIVTSLQKKDDLYARKLIEQFPESLDWSPHHRLMIDEEVWAYAIKKQKYDPKLVFCHPNILLYKPAASLYYRGLCGLSLKTARDYFGAVESLEAGKPSARIDEKKALKMSCTYNTFICSIIKNSTDWTLENGYRTIIATLGITLDGVMRNKIGTIAEERIRAHMLDWLIKKDLILKPTFDEKEIVKQSPRSVVLKNNVNMEFSSEPDISFKKGKDLLAVVEIKGGVDPAGALERYGAATKSFQHAIQVSHHCKNFYLGAVFTPELERRIKEDRLVEKYFDIISILDKPKYREQFYLEIFHHALRLI